MLRDKPGDDCPDLPGGNWNQLLEFVHRNGLRLTLMRLENRQELVLKAIHLRHLGGPTYEVPLHRYWALSGGLYGIP